MGGTTKYLKSGFTIVELLIVVVVIAVLSVIVSVTYSGISQKSHDTAIKSDMNVFAKKISLFQVDRGYYPTSIVDLESLGLKPSQKSYSSRIQFDNFAYCVYHPNASDAQIVIGAVSASNIPYYNYSGDGFTPKVYTGVLDGTTTLRAICQEIMGVEPGFDTTGYSHASGAWRAWAGGP